MADLQLEEQDKIQENIKDRYHFFINDLLVVRLRLIAFIGAVLHLAFYELDRIAYPAYASTFLKIRLVDIFLLSIIIALTYSKKFKAHIVWLGIFATTIIIIGMSIMVFITNGSSSRYYEGANLVFLGYSIINPFYIRHLIFCFFIWIGLWQIAMLGNHQTFNLINFIFANYFMSSTALLVAIMTNFYKNQHYKGFVQNEQLKQNEKSLASLYSQADKLSKTDTLTEINNRRHFSEKLAKKMENTEATKTPFYLVIFDVDHFKEINDNYGHPFGDSVLVKIVEVVKKNVRPTDFIGRFGGDEFIICLDLPNKGEIHQRLAKISTGVRNLGLTHNGKEIPISVSIGSAKFIPGTNMTEKILFEKADAQLINVKKSTRGEIKINE